MRVATVRVEDTTRAARLTDHGADLLDMPDVGALLRRGPDWQSDVDDLVVGRLDRDGLVFAPLIPSPRKILCVGLNYRRHAIEMRAEIPVYPTLFAKFAQSLVGAQDAIHLPHESQTTDWEVELVVVVQGHHRRCSAAEADAAIAGFTVGNDVSERSYQYRTSEWLQGKSWDRTTPVGPALVTTDVLGVAPDLAVSCSLDGEVKQQSRTSDMIFSPPEVIAYISEIMTLEPGDLIFLGTPSGVGSGRQPKEYLTPGVTMRTEIEDIGVLENLCVQDGASAAPVTSHESNGHSSQLAPTIQHS